MKSPLESGAFYRKLAEDVISDVDWAGLDAEYRSKLEVLEAEEQRLSEELQPDYIELVAGQETIREHVTRVVQDWEGTEDFLRDETWSYWIEAMDITVEVTPEAAFLNAPRIGVVNGELLILTDRKTTSASC